MMGMMGRRRQPWGAANGWRIPQVGPMEDPVARQVNSEGFGWQPGANPDQMIADLGPAPGGQTPPYAPPNSSAPQAGGMFGQTGAQPAAKKGNSPILNALLGFIGGGDVASIINQRQQQERQAELEERRFTQQNEREDRRANKPQIMELNDGSVVAIDPITRKSTVISGPVAAPVDPTALQRNIDYYKSLNPQATDADIAALAKAGILGAAYDPAIYRPRMDYAAEIAKEVKRTIPGKAAGSGGGGSGGSSGGGAKLPPGFILNGN